MKLFTKDQIIEIAYRPSKINLMDIKKIIAKIDTYLTTYAPENHELSEGSNYFIDEIDLDDEYYSVDYNCYWEHEDRTHDYPGSDNYKIEIESIILLGDPDRVIYEKDGLFGRIYNAKLNYI